jgi:flagellar motor switch protein FliN/FliY
MVKGECGQPEPAGLERSASPQLARQALPANLDVILDIDLPLAVRFGGTDMTIDALARLGPGALIDLGRSPDDPVDVLVNGRMVARGEVVVIGGNYGVRVTEVVSAADRLRSIAM